MNISEQALIQAALLNNDGAMAVNIGADDFSTDAGQRLWQEISKLLTMTGSADGVSLQDALSGDQACLSELGDCMSITCSPKQIHSYAGIVKRDAKRRRLQSVAQGIIDDGDTDPDELSGRLMSELIGGQAGEKKADYSAQELMAKTIERIDAASEGGQLGLKTGCAR